MASRGEVLAHEQFGRIYLSRSSSPATRRNRSRALNPIVFTEKVVRSFLRYQLTAYPFADEREKNGTGYFSANVAVRPKKSSVYPRSSCSSTTWESVPGNPEFGWPQGGRRTEWAESRKSAHRAYVCIAPTALKHLPCPRSAPPQPTGTGRRGRRGPRGP
jgi:hypothetical protein